MRDQLDLGLLQAIVQAVQGSVVELDLVTKVLLKDLFDVKVDFRFIDRQRQPQIVVGVNRSIVVRIFDEVVMLG